jgi:di/tricarboxylate transporter
MILVFVILLTTIALFISDRLRLDLVAILSLLALTLTGILSPAEALFVITSVLSQIISNTATAVLVAPIASPVNTLVLGPGEYRFGDFFKIGVALQVLILALALLIVPLLFPF